ncbi:hypothetical protein KIH87_15080 [Paraneptunicella aestuarii]|uniref:SdrD B-like domain-containing protein n=1 Tax=Paraneptunicella aestuarii TaxID=2831148 RepID=UPI001E4D4E0D|nr:SdrD B-like domain-containing protein [Paraneptunicella aestuarii]UAA38000.1 hypothetical protein KIH87_15080 [Paraneptunicella aestuarii]
MKLSNLTSCICKALFLTGLSVSSVYAKPNHSFDQYDITDVGWSASYTGCSFNADTQTATYSYQMTVDSAEKDLSHWVLAFDTDMVIVDSTGNANTDFGLDPTTGVYGFKWDSGQDSGTTQTYTLTVNGECNAVATEYSVKGGTYFAIGETMGPSADGGDGPDPTTYAISGSVYIDANNSQSLDIDEPALNNTTVQLLDASGSVIAETLSNSSGDYQFEGLLAGSYSVVVPDTTTDFEGDFNETLTEYYDTWSNMTSVTIDSQDVADVDFGYSADMAAVMHDLDSADPDDDGYSFTGSGKTIGFWKHQHAVALKGKGRAHIDSETLIGYLNTIESLWLANPFQFGTDKISASNEILSARTSDETELLNKQMLATELNHVDGRGLTDNLALQATLLAYGEYVSAYSAQYTREQVLAVKDMMDAINNSGE